MWCGRHTLHNWSTWRCGYSVILVIETLSTVVATACLSEVIIHDWFSLLRISSGSRRWPLGSGVCRRLHTGTTSDTLSRIVEPSHQDTLINRTLAVPNFNLWNQDNALIRLNIVLVRDSTAILNAADSRGKIPDTRWKAALPSPSRVPSSLLLLFTICSSIFAVCSSFCRSPADYREIWNFCVIDYTQSTVRWWPHLQHGAIWADYQVACLTRNGVQTRLMAQRRATGEVQHDHLRYPKNTDLFLPYYE